MNDVRRGTAVIIAALLLCSMLLTVRAAAQDDAGLDSAASDPARYAPYPAPDAGYVTDLADLLSDEQEDELERWLWDVEEQSGIEIAVLTVDSIFDYPGAQARSIEQFARGVFDAWGVGNMPANEGVLLVVAVRDREARIELGAGYGNLRDGDAARIMQNDIIPHFKDGDYSGGIRSGVKAMIGEFAGMRIGWNWPLIILIALVPILIAVAVSLFRNGKRGWGWVCVGGIFVVLLGIFAVLRTTGRSTSSGGGAGGFGGGFGGGFSGGGGATGSW